MLKPKKLSEKDKKKSIYAGPGSTATGTSSRRKFDMSREDRSPSVDMSVGNLPTKKAQTLKTVADKNKRIVQSGQASTSGVRTGLGSKGPVKDRIVHALNKASMVMNSKYKKKEKIGAGGRSVVKEKGLFTREVDGSNQAVREKTKTVTRRDGTVKKTTTKGRGVMGSNIGRYKDTKRYKK